MKQLKEDITALFQDENKIIAYYNDALNYVSTSLESDDYSSDIDYIKSSLIKEEYDNLPNISYPLITISEIENVNGERYWDGSEFATALGYQFMIDAEQTYYHTSNEMVEIIEYIIDAYLQEDKYKCLSRISTTRPYPSLSDPNVKTGVLRYNCYLVSQQNTIYRRY